MKTLVGRKVEVKDIADPFCNNIGTIVFIVQDVRLKDYIVQFGDTWSYFRRWQFKVLPKRGKK